MNNKVYMHASAVSYDPAFIEEVTTGRNQSGEAADSTEVELWLDTDMAAFANTCIALNPERPDFTALVRFLEIHVHCSAEESIEHVPEHLYNLIENAWGLICRFFPLREYGFPSLDLWAWLLSCLVNGEILEPEKPRYPVRYTFDPDHLMSRARIVFLEELLKEKGIDPAQELVEKGFDNKLNRIAEILSVEIRYLVEILPETPFSSETTEARVRVKELIGATLAEPDSHKVPQDYKGKIIRCFVARQFGGKKMEEIGNSQGLNRDTSNISREYNELVKKAGYEPVSPQPRGKNRI